MGITQRYAIEYTPSNVASTEAHEIATLWAKTDKQEEKTRNMRLQIGYRLIDLKQRIDAGEVGQGIEFWQWVKGYINRSRRDMQKCIAMAEAEDPEEAAEAEREAARASMRRTRARRSSVKHEGGLTQSNVVDFPQSQPEDEPEGEDVPSLYDQAVEAQSRDYEVTTPRTVEVQARDYEVTPDKLYQNALDAVARLKPMQLYALALHLIEKMTARQRYDFEVAHNARYHSGGDDDGEGREEDRTHDDVKSGES